MKDARAHLTPEEQEYDRGPIEGGTFEAIARKAVDKLTTDAYCATYSVDEGDGFSDTDYDAHAFERAQKLALDVLTAAHNKASTQAAIQMVVDELLELQKVSHSKNAMSPGAWVDRRIAHYNNLLTQGKGGAR